MISFLNCLKFKIVCKHTLSLLIIFFLINKSFAQKNYILLGSDVPLQYALGYEYKPIKWLGIQAKVGVLTKPYNQAILGIMSLFGTDDKIVKIIDGAFNMGTLGTLTLNFHAKKWYYGLQVQYISLSASDVPDHLVANYFGYNFNPVGVLNVALPTPKVSITMQSNLLQAGACIGRRVTIAPWAEARFELAFAKNIWNKSSVNTSNINQTIFGLQHSSQYLEGAINNKLNKTYTQYAYTPSINIYWVFKF